MAATKYLITSSGSVSWLTAANWSDLVVPASTDIVTLPNSTATFDLGLNQAAVTLASLAIPMTFTGTAGLAAQTPIAITSITRASSTATVTTTAAHGYATNDVVVITGAVETDYNVTATITVTSSTAFTYAVANTPTTPATTSTALVARKYDKLRIGATLFRYGDPGTGAQNASGSGRFNIDFSSIQTTATIINTKSGNATDSNLEPLRIVGTHASNTLMVLGGRVGVATTLPTEVATFATMTITGGTLNCGAGTTWTQVIQNAGTLTLNCGSASTSSYISQGGGALNLAGAGVVANTTFAGAVNFDMRKATAGDTVTGTLVLESGATLDCSGNPAAISFGILRISGTGITIKRNKANPGHVSWTTLTQDPGSSFTLE